MAAAISSELETAKKRENRYLQLTGNNEKTLKSLFPVDWHFTVFFAFSS